MSSFFFFTLSFLFRVMCFVTDCQKGEIVRFYKILGTNVLELHFVYVDKS